MLKMPKIAKRSQAIGIVIFLVVLQSRVKVTGIFAKKLEISGISKPEDSTRSQLLSKILCSVFTPTAYGPLVAIRDEFDITSFPTVVLVDEDMKEVHGGGSEQEPPSRTRGSSIEKFKALVEGNRHMFK